MERGSLPAIEVRQLDDWKGVEDPKTRRILQNRLNQRAHRRRRRMISREKQQQQQQPQQELTPSSALAVDLANLHGLCLLGPGAESSKAILEKMEAFIRMNFATGSPRSDMLLVLTQLNILRALHANIDVLGYDGSNMHDDSLSAFSMTGPQCPTIREENVLPPALQPTVIQRTIAHHPWLDSIPIPQMRDNLIQAGDSYDDLQLCHDMCGRSTRRRIGDKTGIIVWKEPWDPAGWEMTESFLQLWSWAVQDCWELFRSTNVWRERRGEKPLFYMHRTTVAQSTG